MMGISEGSVNGINHCNVSNGEIQVTSSSMETYDVAYDVDPEIIKNENLEDMYEGNDPGTSYEVAGGVNNS
jgi:hypothetical protein